MGAHNRSHLFILDENRNAVPVKEVLQWGEYFRSSDRLVARTTFPDQQAVISTVFWELITVSMAARRLYSSPCFLKAICPAPNANAIQPGKKRKPGMKL